MTGGMLFGELPDEEDDRDELKNGDLFKRLGIVYTENFYFSEVVLCTGT
jgi:hypothetical protein